MTESFQDIINGDKPVLVDFYADWCGPCKMMSPIIEEIGKELQGELRVLKIDVDKNHRVADQYLVQAIPTLVLFKKGEVVWRYTGALDKASLLAQIKSYMG